MSGYRFRQRPGSSNSLGLVKFMFPNQFNVYLHDTPADSLFARASALVQPRLRAARAARQARAIRPRAISRRGRAERIDEAMHAGQETTVKLSAALPVYLGYWTARVSADGILQFRTDLYGIDGAAIGAAVGDAGQAEGARGGGRRGGPGTAGGGRRAGPRG